MYLSLRQSSEWGMRALQGTFTILKSRFTINKLKRKYVVPGSERCVECHKVNDDLVLGFTPLQLNRRSFGEGGRDLPIAQEDLDQVERLKKFGFLQSNLMGLPKLESDFGDVAVNCAPTGVLVLIPFKVNTGKLFHFPI